MNEYLFHTTRGVTIAPKEDYDIENCQVLRFSKGTDKNNALTILLSENPWILEAGFDTSEIIAVKVFRCDN